MATLNFLLASLKHHGKQVEKNICAANAIRLLAWKEHTYYVYSVLLRHVYVWGPVCLICYLCSHRPTWDLLGLCFICLSRLIISVYLQMFVISRFCPPFIAPIWDWKLEDFSLKSIPKIRVCGSLFAWFHMYVNVCMCTFPQVSQG